MKLQETLRTALAMGCDRAIHVQMDPKDYGVMQPLHVSKILARIAQEEKIDIVMVGKQVIITQTCLCSMQRFSKAVKMIFVDGKKEIFLILAQNIDCSYLLEQPQ